MTHHYWKLPRPNRSLYEAGSMIGWIVLLSVIVLMLISGRLG